MKIKIEISNKRMELPWGCSGFACDTLHAQGFEWINPTSENIKELSELPPSYIGNYRNIWQKDNELWCMIGSNFTKIILEKVGYVM